jgi:hypothetical protein
MKECRDSYVGTQKTGPFVRGAKRRREQCTVTDTDWRNTRRLGNKKYLIVQKRKWERAWGFGGSRRREGRLSCEKQRLWVF